MTAAELGKQGRFDRAADLISAAIASGHAEPWMYEAIAVALEAAGRPKTDVERALLSAADFATSPVELLSLANYLARFGSSKQAIRVCKQVTALDPANREARVRALGLKQQAGHAGRSQQFGHVLSRPGTLAERHESLCMQCGGAIEVERAQGMQDGGRGHSIDGPARAVRQGDTDTAQI